MRKRDFSIFDLIFENLPINLDGAMKPQKKWQTFLYQNIPQPAQLAHPRVSNSPRKVYPMWRDSWYIFAFPLLLYPYKLRDRLTYEVETLYAVLSKNE